MSRMPRVVAVGLPHHVTVRGNYRQSVFLQDEDYQFYLSLLGKKTGQSRISGRLTSVKRGVRNRVSY